MDMRHPSIEASLVFSIILTLMAALPALAADVPEYAGAYSGQLVWQNEVTMTDDVLILQGASLIVHPGTQVNVVPAEGTKIDPEYLSSQTELLIRGRLDIQGTADRPVRFVVVDKKTTEEIAWAGIIFDHAGESRLQNVTMSRADTAIRCVGSSPRIADSKISDCRYGIIAQDKSHPRIVGNSLSDGEGGIFCWGGSDPYIVDNQLTGHDEEALFIDRDSSPELGANRLWRNAIGLALYPGQINYQRVVSQDNQENLRWLGTQGQGR